MEHSHTQGGGEAAAQAGADPDKAAEEHQSQRHQGQEKLASPQVCTKERALTKKPNLQTNTLSNVQRWQVLVKTVKGGKQSKTAAYVFSTLSLLKV